MNTRDIRTSTPITACDVCGRTLLRGERAHMYLDGPVRHSVCELCVSRAVQEGWVREGAEPPYDGRRGGPERRRSLLARLLGRRERASESDFEPAPEREGRAGRGRRGRRDPVEPAEPALALEADEYEYSREDHEAPAPVPARRPREPVREPRHVRAIPTSTEQKFAAALDAFNASEYRKTVAGVARSLGMPTVAVLPVEGRTGLVSVIASWELCWYRYEVDLSEDPPGVQVAAQGYELDELTPAERQPAAVADESGALALAG